MSYKFEWHILHGRHTDNSARIILQKLQEVHAFRTVLDVGCGDGRWLRQCETLGVDAFVGVDGPWNETERLLIPAENFFVQNLEAAFDLKRKFDMVLSLEVAEHVASECAEQFVANLVAHGDFVLFGAAIPYQGGFRHINERWQSYWAGLFQRHGYVAFDLIRASIWNDPAVHVWYRQNTLVYVNGARQDLLDNVSDYIARNGIQQLPLDIVHPEKYEAVASYNQIAFRPLIKNLPRGTVQKVYQMMTGGN